MGMGATTLATRSPSYVLLRFVLLRALGEKPVQSIKDHTALLEQFAIVSEHFTEPVNNRLEPRSLQPMKLGVLQIYIVNYLGDLTQTFATAQAKSFEHRLEGAILAVMRKLGPKHVERNRALHRLALGDKVKARAFVDELPDESSGSQPVDMKVASGHPATTLVVRQIEGSRLCDRASGF